MTVRTAGMKSFTAVVVLGLVSVMNHTAKSQQLPGPDPSVPPQPLSIEVQWGGAGKAPNTPLGKNQQAKVTITNPDGKLVASGKTDKGFYKTKLPINIFYSYKATVGDQSCTGGIRVGMTNTYALCQIYKSK